MQCVGGNYIALKAYIRNKIFKVNDLNFQFQKLESEQKLQKETNR